MYTLRLLSILLLGFIFPAVLLAGDFYKPDMKQIEKNIRNKNSTFYYPVLMKRFLAGDTSLKLEEKRCLYYGFSFEEKYSPYGIPENADDSLRAIFRKDTLTPDDYNRVFLYADTLLNSNPLNLRVLFYRNFAAYKTEKEELRQKTRTQIHAILDAIISSGDGKSVQTAFWVTAIADEYEIIEQLDLEFGGQQSLTNEGPCDYLTIKKNKWGINGLYFNVSISMKQMNKMFQDKK